jgi:hypothetical protein
MYIIISMYIIIFSNYANMPKIMSKTGVNLFQSET